MPGEPTQGAQPVTTISEFLEADHRRLDQILEGAKQLVDAGALSEARGCFVDLASGLNRHIDAEEEILFPAFERLTGHMGPTAVMRAEHLDIRAWMDTAAEALDAGDAAAFKSAVHALSVTLSAHNMKEESVLYPATDAAAGSRTREELVDRMRAR